MIEKPLQGLRYSETYNLSILRTTSRLTEHIDGSRRGWSRRGGWSGDGDDE